VKYYSFSVWDLQISLISLSLIEKVEKMNKIIQSVLIGLLFYFSYNIATLHASVLLAS